MKELSDEQIEKIIDFLKKGVSFPALEVFKNA
jgi:hypothetical protein